MKQKIIYLHPSEIKPYFRNPRINESAIDPVAESIQNYGFRNPILLDKNKVIIAGHTRLKAAIKIDLKEIPCIIADDMPPYLVAKYRIADNKLGEIAEWDYDILQEELKDLINQDLDVGGTGFSMADVEKILLYGHPEKREKYTRKVHVPIYKPSRKKPKIQELFDNKKERDLIKKIEEAEISDQDKDFLIQGAKRHVVFYYDKIADYYSRSDKKVQELMEDSALIIIDFKKAIEQGIVKLNREIRKQYKEDNE